MILSLSAVFILAHAGMGQLFLFEQNARTIGLSGTGCMLSGMWSAYSNPSGLAATKEFSMALGYRNYYQIPELGTGSVMVALPSKRGCFAAAFSASGLSTFRQQIASAWYAMNLSKTIRAGIGMNWLHVSQPAGYPGLYAIVPSAGFQITAAKNLVTGVAIFNPASQQFRPNGYLNIPFIISAGAGYYLGKEVFIGFQMQKQSDNPLHYSGGVECNLVENIVLRLGLSSWEVISYSAGLGFRFRKINANIAVIHHPVLGFSPALDLSYSL